MVRLDAQAFEDAVTRHFVFLCDELGFERSTSRGDLGSLVKFSSGQVVVDLFFSTRTYELETYIGLAGRGREFQFPLEWLVGKPSWSWGLAQNREDLEIQVQKVAQFLLKHGTLALQGDRATFQRLAANR